MVTKAVFFDIDGTLLNDRKRVSKSTQEAIQALKDSGIIVGLATGRGPAFAHTYMENLQLDVAVCYNGQYIFTRDRILYQNQLAKSSVYALLRYAKRHHKEISLGLQDGLGGSNIISAGTSSIGQLVASTLPDYQNIVARVQAAQTRNQEMRDQIELWSDSSYIASQARERLGYVKPGETVYSVVDPGEGYQDAAQVAAASTEGTRRPWVQIFSLLTQEADNADSATPIEPATPTGTTTDTNQSDATQSDATHSGQSQ